MYGLLLIDLCSEQALCRSTRLAAQRADELLAKGNIEGQRVFKNIVKAINELQKNQPGESERVN